MPTESTGAEAAGDAEAAESTGAGDAEVAGDPGTETPVTETDTLAPDDSADTPTTTAQQASPAQGYVPLTPTRIVDTRRSQGISSRLSAGTVRGFRAGSEQHVPAGAKAVVLTVTTTDAAGPGWVSVFPCGDRAPATSSVNLRRGQPVANQVLVGIGRGSSLGEVCALASTGVHLVVDLLGYFTADATYRPMTPERIADTRPGTAAPGSKGIVSGGATLRVKAAGTAGIAADAVAASVNVTVTQPATSGYLTLFPCSQPRPLASMINFTAGQTVANAAMTDLGTDGWICLYASTTTHVVVDITGSFGPGGDLTTRVPVRLADTRPGKPGGWQKGAIAAGRVFEVPVVGRNGVPNGATAALLNLTVVAPSSAGWAVVYPCQEPRPLASNVNFAARATVAASVTATLSPRGTVCVYSTATTHLVIDLVGHYRGQERAPAAGSTFVRADGIEQRFAVEPNGAILPVSAGQLAAAGNPPVQVFPVVPGTAYQRAAWSPVVYAVEPGVGSRRLSLPEWIALLTPAIREVPLVAGSSIVKTANSATLYVVSPDGKDHKMLSSAEWRSMGSPAARTVTAAPGSRFVRTERSHAVYAMAPDGTTRWLNATEYAAIGSPRVEILRWRPVVKGVTAGDLWATYRPGCPVGPSRLIRFEFPFWDFAGRLQTGALIMAATSRAALESTMRSAFDDHFPLREVTPVEKYRGNDVASMSAGNTSAFNCRPVVGNPTRLSQHSYGNAVDINPAQNPYVTASAVYPAGSQTYLDRSCEAARDALRR